MNSVDELLDNIPNTLKSKGTSPISAVILLRLTGSNPAQYHIKLENGESSVMKGGIDNPDLSLSVSAEDLLLLSRGELDPGKAFMMGRLGISGDISIALKLLGQISGN